MYSIHHTRRGILRQKNQNELWGPFFSTFEVCGYNKQIMEGVFERFKGTPVHVLKNDIKKKMCHTFCPAPCFEFFPKILNVL